MDTGFALLLKTAMKLIKYVKHLFESIGKQAVQESNPREVGSTHSVDSFLRPTNFLTTVQTAGIQVEHGGSFVLRRQ